MEAHDSAAADATMAITANDLIMESLSAAVLLVNGGGGGGRSILLRFQVIG